MLFEAKTDLEHSVPPNEEGVLEESQHGGKSSLDPRIIRKPLRDHIDNGDILFSNHALSVATGLLREVGVHAFRFQAVRDETRQQRCSTSAASLPALANINAITQSNRYLLQQ